MSRFWFSIIVFLTFLQLLGAGTADGSYTAEGGRFDISWALAERVSDGGAIRILLAREAPPESADRDHHLNRLDTLCDSAAGGCIIVEPVPGGSYFNVTLKLNDLGYGGGGQYPSRIDAGAGAVTGTIDSDVMDGHLTVTFEADFMPPRKVTGDLPADGGEPGAALMAQFDAIASGDRDAILATLSDEQRQMFDQLSPEDQKEALASSVEFAPKNVRLTGGVLYDGYAIVTYEAEEFGERAKGRALLSLEKDRWLVREVSTAVG